MVIATSMTNSDFLSEVYGDLAPGQHGWVCHFQADPSNAPPTVWAGRLYKGTPQQALLIDRAGQDNTYFCTSVLTATEDGDIARIKAAFVRLAVLVLDDVQLQDLQGYSYAIQTSPGKHQVGILIDSDDVDAQDRRLVDLLMQALATRGYIKADKSGNNAVRYVRLPRGRNTKPRAAGEWQVRLESWTPQIRWSLEDACAAIGINLDHLRAASTVETARSASSPGPSSQGVHAGEMIAGLTGPIAERAYHDNITRLAASLVSNGMFPGAAVEFLRDLMHQVKPAGPEEEVRRWQARYDEIPRAVKSAEQFAPEARQPKITVNLNRPSHVDSETGEITTPASSPDSDVVPMDWAALRDTEPEPITWAVDGLLPHRRVTLLAANGGVGKSNLSLQLAVAAASGQQWLGIDTEPGKVMVISAEDDHNLVHLRVRNICTDVGVDMSQLAGQLIAYDLTQTDCALWVNGQTTERMQWLANETLRHRPSLLILDNASDLFNDNENDRNVVRTFIRCLQSIAQASGCAVLLLAHVDKASVRTGAGSDTDSTFSGSTAWNNSARSRIAMFRGQDKREIIVKHEKCNVGPTREQFSIEFDASAKVFRIFGTVPGAKAAASLVRNTQRAAILKLVDQADKAGQKLSMSAQANNNAFRVLKASPEFPQRMDRSEFFSILFDLQRERLIEEVEYMNERKKFKRLCLTTSGLARVAIGSGAPPINWNNQGTHDD